MLALEEYVQPILAIGLSGRVTRVVGYTASVAGFPAPLGATCLIRREQGPAVEAEVVGLQGEETLVLPYGDLGGVRRGNRVELKRSVPAVRVGERLLGRIIDGMGRSIDGRPPATLPERVPLQGRPTAPLGRPRISEPLGTGIRTIDSLLTCGKGQRLGIFAGSGVGKSTLLGQMAKYSSSDVNVIVLVGERGREVREFVERDLGSEGLARSVVVVATSDQSPLLRLRAAFLGTAIAEYFRDLRRDVLLMMDSVTRFAYAQREIGLAAGEPPATRGYPPSVFALLPRLLERSGRSDRGSITGFYTVLVEADDANEPISDAVRSILDGHVMLSRRLAERAHWPAIDVLSSISRSMSDVIEPGHRAASDNLKHLMAAYQQSEDLIAIGAYQAGSNPQVDIAIRMRDQINAHLRQATSEHVAFAQAAESLMKLDKLREGIQQTSAPAPEARSTARAARGK
jgi:FliI/YscN family ATPase